MTKRKTKEQREADERAALLQRITDIYSGANGGVWTEDEFAYAELLSRVVPVLRKLFLCEEMGRMNAHCFEPHCLNYYDTPKAATEFLFDKGVRA